MLFVLLGGLAIGMVVSFYKYWKLENKWIAPHPISVYALWFQILGIFSKLVHLWIYSGNGKGYIALDVGSTVLQGISEVIIALLLIFLASGWKLTFEEIEFDDNLEIYVPFSALTFMVQLILCILTVVDMDASHKYHDFAGLQGWMLVILKFALLGFFAYCIWDTRSKSNKQDHLNYMNSLAMIGTVYLLAVPTAVIVTFMFEPYER